MGEILILENIVSEVTSHQDPCVLFGKKDYVNAEGTFYDFIFHSLKIHYEKANPGKLLAVPVLPVLEDSQAVIAANDLYRIHPNFSRIAFRDTKNRLRHKNQIYGTFLTFLDIKKNELGTSVESLPDYTITNEQEFRNHFPNGSEIWSYIMSLKEQVDKQHC